MLYADFARYLLSIKSESRMISYWKRLITGKKGKFPHFIYKYMLELQKFELKCIRSIETDTWHNQTIIQTSTLKYTVMTRICIMCIHYCKTHPNHL